MTIVNIDGGSVLIRRELSGRISLGALCGQLHVHIGRLTLDECDALAKALSDEAKRARQDDADDERIRAAFAEERENNAAMAAEGGK